MLVKKKKKKKNASLHLQAPSICLNVSLRPAAVISSRQRCHYGLFPEPKKAPPVTGCESIVTGDVAGAIPTGKTAGGMSIFIIAHELKERKWRLKRVRVQAKVKGRLCMEERLEEKKNSLFFYAACYEAV